MKIYLCKPRQQTIKKPLFSRGFRSCPDGAGLLYGGGGGNRTRVRRTYNLNYYTVSQLLDLTDFLRT